MRLKIYLLSLIEQKDFYFSLDSCGLHTTHISCSNRVVLAVFEVVLLLSVLSTCGTASHHLFVSLHYHLSDEQYMMLICRFHEM